MVVVVPVAAQQLEEIVVTAERRETQLQDTPISLVALTEEALQSKGVELVNWMSGNEVAPPTPALQADPVSSTVGGKPTRSRLTRRSKIPRSASGEGGSFSASSRARVNRSIADLHQAGF